MYNQASSSNFINNSSCQSQKNKKDSFYEKKNYDQYIEEGFFQDPNNQIIDLNKEINSRQVIRQDQQENQKQEKIVQQEEKIEGLFCSGSEILEESSQIPQEAICNSFQRLSFIQDQVLYRAFGGLRNGTNCNNEKNADNQGQNQDEQILNMKNDEKCFENDKYEGLKFVPNFNENEEFFAGFQPFQLDDQKNDYFDLDNKLNNNNNNCNFNNEQQIKKNENELCYQQKQDEKNEQNCIQKNLPSQMDQSITQNQITSSRILNNSENQRKSSLSNEQIEEDEMEEGYSTISSEESDENNLVQQQNNNINNQVFQGTIQQQQQESQQNEENEENKNSICNLQADIQSDIHPDSAFLIENNNTIQTAASNLASGNQILSNSSSLNQQQQQSQSQKQQIIQLKEQQFLYAEKNRLDNENEQIYLSQDNTNFSEEIDQQKQQQQQFTQFKQEKSILTSSTSKSNLKSQFQQQTKQKNKKNTTQYDINKINKMNKKQNQIILRKQQQQQFINDDTSELDQISQDFKIVKKNKKCKASPAAKIHDKYYRQSRHKNVFKNFGNTLRKCIECNFEFQTEIEKALKKQPIIKKFIQWIEKDLELQRKKDFVEGWTIHATDSNEINTFKSLFKFLSKLFFQNYAEQYLNKSNKIQAKEIHIRSIPTFLKGIDNPDQILRFKPQ